MRSNRSRVAGSIALIVTAGCGSSATDSASTDDSASTAPASTATTTAAPVTSDASPPRPTLPPAATVPTTTTAGNPPEGSSMTTPPQSDSDVSIASADLAVRLGVEAASIELVTRERVTWRDGSIGCPEPGMAYTQALVPGIRIVLRVADAEYEYHAADGRPPFYCPPERVTTPAPNPDV